MYCGRARHVVLVRGDFQGRGQQNPAKKKGGGKERKEKKTYLHNRIRNQIPHAQVLLQKQPHLGRADVVLDDLADDPDVALVLAQRGERLINVGAGALDDEGAVRAEDGVEVLGRPEAGFAWRGWVG